MKQASGKVSALCEVVCWDHSTHMDVHTSSLYKSKLQAKDEGGMHCRWSVEDCGWQSNRNPRCHREKAAGESVTAPTPCQVVRPPHHPAPPC